MSERVGNVSRSRYEELVAEARDLVEQVARAQFGLGDRALEIEPMRPVGGSVAKGGEDLFTVEESLQRFADDIGVALSTVEDWRWVASRWPAGKRRAGVSFTVHKILAWHCHVIENGVTTSGNPDAFEVLDAENLSPDDAIRGRSPKDLLTRPCHAPLT
ncbi:hypothetical protein [Streptomyces sp. NBC_01264]|uniref:hypothetical protein n=1 Tax=Streptomyces sp. NBC_01264 TaxID=2903804 RepID=UPI00225B6ADA|nr:hypothetical protein [Streptomyces sp. NBC_01264]MCX4775370.1 hypothetical protein [Streptomyces sp. NBC_01264]